MKNKILMLIILILLIVTGVVGYLIFTELNKTNSVQNNTNESLNTNNTNNTGNNSNNSSNNLGDSITNDKNIKIDTDVKSIYNENIKFTKAPQIYAPEILFLDALYKEIEKSDWNGEGGLPVKLSDISKSLYNEMLDYESKRLERLTVPKDYEEYYLSKGEANYLQDLLMKSRDEYLDFLEQKGVNQKYIKEFDTNGLPADEKRLKYRADIDPNAPASGMSTWAFGKDSSQRAGNFYALDVYNYARQIENSGVQGPKPTKKSDLENYIKTSRDMGLRMLAFHEFTHVLQTAYGTVNADESDKGKVNVALYLETPLNIIDKKYFLEWGNESSNAIKNNQSSEERQANGISFLAMAEVYDLSEQQSEILWEHRFGRLSNAAKIFNTILPALNENYPKLRLVELDILLNQAILEDNNLTEEQKDLLNTIRSRFSIFGSDNGYYNTMAPTDAGKFWDMLK